MFETDLDGLSLPLSLVENRTHIPSAGRAALGEYPPYSDKGCYVSVKQQKILEGNVAKERTSELINVLESRGITVDINGEEDIF